MFGIKLPTSKSITQSIEEVEDLWDAKLTNEVPYSAYYGMLYTEAAEKADLADEMRNWRGSDYWESAYLAYRGSALYHQTYEETTRCSAR